jgi:hypothetical protein
LHRRLELIALIILFALMSCALIVTLATLGTPVHPCDSVPRFSAAAANCAATP